ncbi:MAG: hypothetical protein Q3966_02400 [Neisseria sp.]|nr:hypothetical protein [Neisseria sp.]
MAIDRIDWHYEADGFPDGAPDRQAGAHIGFFLAWAFSRGFAGEGHLEDDGDELADLAARRISGTDFLIRMCDGKLWDEDFNEEGAAFAQDYYANHNSAFAREYGCYLQDYGRVFAEYGDYCVEDGWENFDRLTPLLDERLAQWRRYAAK